MRIAAVAALLLLLVVGALAVALPRIEASDALRERARAELRARIEGETDFARVELGLLPLRLGVRELTWSRGEALSVHLDRVELAGNALRGQGPGEVRIDALRLAGEFDLQVDDEAWRVSGVLAEGGRIEGAGELRPGVGPSGRVELDAVALAPFAALLRFDGGTATLGGHVSGMLESTDGQRWQLDLASEDAAVESRRIQLAGGLDLEAWVEPRAPSDALGRFELDAGPARFSLDGLWQKPAGAGARVGGRLVREADGGLDVDEIELHATDFRVTLPGSR